MTPTAQLCPVVEGVLFTFSDDDRPLRGLILRDALEAVFGAEGVPDSWLAAFHANADTIVRIATQLHRVNPSESLVLMRWRHFEQLVLAAAQAA